MDGVVDISGGVVGNVRLHAARQFLLDLLQFGPDVLDDIDRVRVWQNPDAHENGFLPGEPDLRVVIFGAEDDVGDVAQPNECALVFLDDELLELIRRVQVGVRSQVDLQHRTLRAADRRKIIVASTARSAHLPGGH